MAVRIEDGKGTGYIAEVDNENRLSVSSLSRSVIGIRSEEGFLFGITTPHLTVTTTGGRMLWIKNISTTLSFKIDGIWFNYDGGSTSHDETIQCEVWIRDTEPDTNVTTGSASNLNTSSSYTADLTIKYWDGVGNGMTGHSNGTAAFYFQCGYGSTSYHLDGSLIIGPSKTLSFNMKTDGESGVASINLTGIVEL